MWSSGEREYLCGLLQFSVANELECTAKRISGLNLRL